MSTELVKKDDILELLYEIKDNPDTPKNYGTLLDIISKVRGIPAVINSDDARKKIHKKYHETCDRIECDYDCENCGHQELRFYMIDILKGEIDD